MKTQPTCVVEALESMNSHTTVVITMLILAVGLHHVAAETNIETGVRTSFAPEARLSAVEMATVIELAKLCGLPEVAEISTYNNYHPSAFYSISVKSREIERGREVSFVRVQIDCEKWSSREFRQSSDIVKSIGGFWAARGAVTTNVLTTFSLSGKTIHLRVSDAIPLAIADEIVHWFATGNVRFADQKTKEIFKEIDISQAVGLDRDKEHYAICFSPAQWTLLWVFFTLDTNGVTIVRADKLVS